MKTEIIKIGNDYGVVIRSNILISAGSKIKLSIKKAAILMNPDIRIGWADAAKK